MSQQELLEKVVAVLDGLGIDYLITGSIASSMQGEPRSTHDIDVVILLPPEIIGSLAAAFPSPTFFLQTQAIHDALRNLSMFNLLSLADGEKVDFWIRTEEPFDQSRFARRETVSIGGRPVKVSAPEDTILAKLRWAKLSGGSNKQFMDALRVFEVQGQVLDFSYLEEWAKRLEIEELWQRIKTEAKII